MWCPEPSTHSSPSQPPTKGDSNPTQHHIPTLSPLNLRPLPPPAPHPLSTPGLDAQQNQAHLAPLLSSLLSSAVTADAAGSGNWQHLLNMNPQTPDTQTPADQGFAVPGRSPRVSFSAAAAIPLGSCQAASPCPTPLPVDIPEGVSAELATQMIMSHAGRTLRARGITNPSVVEALQERLHARLLQRVRAHMMGQQHEPVAPIHIPSQQQQQLMELQAKQQQQQQKIEEALDSPSSSALTTSLCHPMDEDEAADQAAAEQLLMLAAIDQGAQAQEAEGPAKPTSSGGRAGSAGVAPQQQQQQVPSVFKRRHYVRPKLPSKLNIAPAPQPGAPEAGEKLPERALTQQLAQHAAKSSPSSPVSQQDTMMQLPQPLAGISGPKLQAASKDGQPLALPHQQSLPAVAPLQLPPPAAPGLLQRSSGSFGSVSTLLADLPVAAAAVAAPAPSPPLSPLLRGASAVAATASPTAVSLLLPRQASAAATLLRACQARLALQTLVSEHAAFAAESAGACYLPPEVLAGISQAAAQIDAHLIALVSSMGGVPAA